MIDSLKVLPVGTILRSQSLAYTIVEVLGQGGFGITYRATAILTVGNIKTTAQFAIKEHFVDRYCERDSETNAVAYSRPVASEVENSRKDFLSEARRLRDLSKSQNRHPNIVCVNETFEANNTAYFVMEYLEGESLSSYVKRRGRLNDDEMRHVMKPIIDAVAFLHRERITHLDIKPANIMLTRGDIGELRPVLIDFGLSRHFDPETDEPSSSIQQAGFSAGYAPIEQVEAFSHFYPATDVYSLGATMLFALTGNTPVSAANLDEETLRNAIPAGLDTSTVTAITEAMHYIRKQRPKDAGALLSILNENDSTQIIGDDEIIPEVYVEPETPSTPKSVGESSQFSYVKHKTTYQPILTPLPKRSPRPDPRVVTPPAKSKKGLYIGISVLSLLVLLCVAWFTNCFGLIGHGTKAQDAQQPYHIIPNHLDLAVEYDGERGYFSSDEWTSLSSEEQDMYQKIGIYIDAENEDDFIVKLHVEEGGHYMEWDEAMAKYSAVMPTKAQGETLSYISYETWESKMNAYGGDIVAGQWFWTNEKYESSSEWVFSLGRGICPTGKADKCKVVTVATVEDNKTEKETTKQTELRYDKEMSPGNMMTIDTGDGNTMSAVVKQSPSGLIYAIFDEGTGEKIGQQTQALAQYRGMHADGSTFDEGEGTFTPNQVISGFGEGLMMLGKGGKAMFRIPGNLGYGAQGVPQAGIKPNETIYFMVDVIDM